MNFQLSISLANSNDLPVILGLERQFGVAAHWPEKTYREALESRSAERIVRVAKVRNQIVAFLVARFTVDECELENIVVAVPHRCQGIASELLQNLISVARERQVKRILLEVRQSNAPAIAVYCKFGFERTGFRKSYYSNPVEDAILYWLTLGVA